MVEKRWALPTDEEKRVSPNPSGEEAIYNSYASVSEVHRVHVISDEELEVVRGVVSALDRGVKTSPESLFHEQLRAILPAPELLPCPFCSGGASLNSSSTSLRWVECDSDDCAISGPIRATDALAIEAWSGAMR